MSIAAQTLAVMHGPRRVTRFSVSTSRRPPSCVENSLGTPTGLHALADKLGDGEPLGMVFKGRLPTGKCYPELPANEQEANLITTRIIRLRGLEPGKNAGDGVDSYNRYIYIHGTNQEDRIGTPNSHGCVLLTNAAMVQLFDTVASGWRVWIE